MRICIGESQPNIRSGLRSLLESQPGWKVTAEAATGRELLHHVRLIDPDLVLLDWDLPGYSPEDLLNEMRLSSPDLIVIALSVRSEVGPAALDAGANAFAGKEEPPEQYLALIRLLTTEKVARSQRMWSWRVM